jgi:hypothetical protein
MAGGKGRLGLIATVVMVVLVMLVMVVGVGSNRRCSSSLGMRGSRGRRADAGAGAGAGAGGVAGAVGSAPISGGGAAAVAIAERSTQRWAGIGISRLNSAGAAAGNVSKKSTKWGKGVVSFSHCWPRQYRGRDNCQALLRFAARQLLKRDGIETHADGDDTAPAAAAPAPAAPAFVVISMAVWLLWAQWHATLRCQVPTSLTEPTRDRPSNPVSCDIFLDGRINTPCFSAE